MCEEARSVRSEELDQTYFICHIYISSSVKQSIDDVQMFISTGNLQGSIAILLRVNERRGRDMKYFILVVNVDSFLE
jgi:dTDP-D-glucose 4,6-dehydratase